MTKPKKNIGILTSSRADFGIYLPLLESLKTNSEFQVKIIAFGTHLSHYHGHTADSIEASGFKIDYKVNSLLLHDDENAVASAVSLTMMKFSEFWLNNKDQFDIVLCLGDRYEMFGAVYAGVPYSIKFAHIHGGETTLGAIDNVYRHAISLASGAHFVTIPEYAEKVNQLTLSDKIITTGSLGLAGLESVQFYSVAEMIETFQVDFTIPSILITVHPETVESQLNEKYAQVCGEVFKKLAANYQLVITMPNADTQGTVYRKMFDNLNEVVSSRCVLIENFGTKGYFSAMKYSSFLIGNTSSGIIEAASFNKYVINLGDRQKGRARSENVIDVAFDVNNILSAVEKIEGRGKYVGTNIYHQEDTVKRIVKSLKNFLA